MSGLVVRRKRSPTSNVSCYYHIPTFTFRDFRCAQAAARALLGVIVMPMKDVRGDTRAARCLGVMDNACVGLQWEALVFVLLRVSVCNILAGPSLMQRQLVILATKTRLRCLSALR